MKNFTCLEYADDLGRVKVLSHAEAKRQYKAMRDGDLNAKNLLIESSLKWAKQLVSNFTNKYQMNKYYEDILQDLNVHLCRKIDRWRPHKGKLSTFVAVCARNVLLNWFRYNGDNETIAHIPYTTVKKVNDLLMNPKSFDEHDAQNRRNILAAIPIITGTYYYEVDKAFKRMSCGEEHEDFTADSVDNHILQKEEDNKTERIELVSRLLEMCTEQERQLIKLHYFDGLTGSQIAAMYNVTKAAINMRLKKLLSMLRYAVDNDVALSRKIYSRNCPQCESELNYKSLFDFNRASKRKTLCHSCTKKNCLTMN